jgi:putative hydrolase
MSLLEGHADVVMGAVGDDVIPGASRFAKVLSDRRESAKGGAKFVQQLLGIEAKLRQYKDGERFIEAVVDVQGMAGFSRVWASKENLPTIEEIAEPELWMMRIAGSVSPTA